MWGDACFFIALFRKSDAWHDRAQQILSGLKPPALPIRVTSHVVEETVSYIFRKDGSESAFRALTAFLESGDVAVEPVCVPDLAAAAPILRKYGHLSLSDSLLVHAALQNDGAVLSFDSDFDRVKGIRRIA